MTRADDVPGLSEVEATQLLAQSELLSNMLTMPTLPQLDLHYDDEQGDYAETASEPSTNSCSSAVHLLSDRPSVFSGAVQHFAPIAESVVCIEEDTCWATRKRKHEESDESPTRCVRAASLPPSPADSITSCSAAKPPKRVSFRKLELRGTVQRMLPRLWVQQTVWCEAHCSDQQQVCNKPASSSPSVQVYVIK